MMLFSSYSIINERGGALDMVDNKTLTQNDIDKLAESIFSAAEKQLSEKRQAEKLDVTASFVRSKLAIQ